MDQSSDFRRSAFAAGDDRCEYNVYIETARVENAWPAIPEWSLSNQLGPLLVSLEIALKILDDTLDETGNRVYLNDEAKADVVQRGICSLLKLMAEITFERAPRDSTGGGMGYRRPLPDALFGPPSRNLPGEASSKNWKRSKTETGSERKFDSTMIWWQKPWALT